MRGNIIRTMYMAPKCWEEKKKSLYAEVLSAVSSELMLLSHYIVTYTMYIADGKLEIPVRNRE